MAQFPHLLFRETFEGTHRARGGGDLSDLSKENKKDNQRAGHGTSLKTRITTLKQEWDNQLEERRNLGLFDLPNPDIKPVFLRIDPKVLDVDFLEAYGIDIISEELDGYVIGTSSDNYGSLEDKINLFLNKTHGGSSVAQLWDIINGNQWRVEYIISEDLQIKWDQIPVNENIVVDVSVSCFVKKPNFITTKPSSKRYAKSIAEYEEKIRAADQKRDQIGFERQNLLERFLQEHQGELLSDYLEFPDSFSTRISISGKGLKDLVFNFQYLFDVSEPEDIHVTDSEGLEDSDVDLQILPPKSNSPTICVIDSGIQEGHKLLAVGIKTELSRNFIEETVDVADRVNDGGHGTRVAGVIEYFNSIPDSGQHQLPFWIVNAKILDDNGRLPKNKSAAELMNQIVQAYHTAKVKIYNLSIGSTVGHGKKHMSVWASTIDRLSFEKDVLFIVSAGNLPTRGTRNLRGIIDFLQSGTNYPDYLLESVCRICNPAQSIFAITVGSIAIDSIDDGFIRSLSQKDHISSFSRTGLGIWDSPKPDVVEYGGDFVHIPITNSFSNRPPLSPELVRSTFHGGNFKSRDKVGTSFSAPKVTHIAAEIQRLFPRESTLFIKNLLIQSARWPDHCNRDYTLGNFRFYGYGIPNLDRAVDNSTARITFYTSKNIKPKQAHLFTVKIPDALRRPGLDDDILIEVTLTYKAEPRRTRKFLKGYLSALCEWEISGGETFDEFRQAMIKEVEDVAFERPRRATYDWVLGNKTNEGYIEGISRKRCATQKDWAIVKAYELPSELHFAVISRLGWAKDLRDDLEYCLTVSFEAINSELPIYSEIRAANIEIEV